MKQIGKYQIIDFLGSGAYAEVYKAEDTALHRTVALKLLKPALLADDDAVARFMKEAQTAANLIHPQIAWVWDVGNLEGRYYIAMRFIDGKPLDQVLQSRSTLPWEEVRSIFEHMCTALTFAHERGLIHRDVKPQNIMISPTDGAVLTDFGLVRAMEGSGIGTRTGVMIGTPAYMAPEIWRGESADAASDQYALACVLVEMLTGQPLFGAPTPPAVMLRHFEALSLPEKWTANCPVELSTAVRRALSQKTHDRYASVSEFLHAAVPPAIVTPQPDLTDVKAAIEAAIRLEDWHEVGQLLDEAEALVPGDRTVKYYRRKLQKALVEQIKTAETTAETPESNQHQVDTQVSAEPATNPVPTTTDQTGSEIIILKSNNADAKIERPAQAHLRFLNDRAFLWLTEDQEMEFICIPAGEFWMGSDPQKDKDTYSDELPWHCISLPEYWIGRSPVTNAQYAVFVQAVGGEAPSSWQNHQPPTEKLNHPVVNVSWYDAVAYSDWLSKLTEQKIGLPTEAEWEKAARGPDGRIYPWGNEEPDINYCNFSAINKDTTPVGQYSPLGDSLYGCVDMAGNVWEWCADWYSENYYARSPQSSPPGPTGGQFRVLRGGSWGYDARHARVAYRGTWNPDNRSYYRGFRCVLRLAS